MTTIPATLTEGQGTVELNDVMWKKAVNIVSDMAYRKLGKPLESRVSAATALAMDRSKVLQTPEGHWEVQGRHRWYEINGACECEDFKRGDAPEGYCKHRICVGIVRRASAFTPEELDMHPGQLLAEEEEPADKPPPAQTPLAEPPEAGVGSTGEREDARAGQEDHGEEEPQPIQIPSRFLQVVQGTKCIKYAGLLRLAHERGLMELRAEFTHNEEKLSLAHAVAIFKDGGRFEESGDSTPSNGARVKEHWRRLSLTRAKARTLRDALSIDMVAVEEME
jgi:hypothetical protein